jgi:DNA-binding NarL/FixJ family response regulator
MPMARALRDSLPASRSATIAPLLALSASLLEAVKAQLARIFEMLAVDNRTAAARVAREQGLIAAE